MAARRGSGTRAFDSAISRRLEGGEAKPEGAAAARLTVHADGASVGLDQLANDHEAQARSGDLVLGIERPHVTSEESGQNLRCDPPPRVLDAHDDGAFVALDRDPH